jgi:dTDP-3-amino-3,4,6-trideoxy-alpha-D-glucose transaminase
MAPLSLNTTDKSVAPILLNDFKAQWEDIRDAALAAFDRVGNSGWLILGKEVVSFEQQLAHVWELPYCIGCASGLDAIEISLRCLGARPGDKVLTTPLSAFATTLAIVRAGCVPLFVDVDESGLLDLNQCADILREEEGIRFLLPVHLFGHSINLKRLSEIGDRFDITIIEDCAQAVGAKSNGVTVGSVSAAAATSFYPTKNLGCMGDGGAILTKDPDVASVARSLRDYGQSEKYRHSFIGLNSRLDEVQAAILKDALLPLLPRFTQQRRDIAKAYLKKITNPDLVIPPIPEGSESVWHLFPLIVKGDRSAFQMHLGKAGVASGIHYPILITDQNAMKAFDQSLVRRELRNAKRFAEQEVSLPIHPYLSDHDIERVIAACNSWRQ